MGSRVRRALARGEQEGLFGLLKSGSMTWNRKAGLYFLLVTVGLFAPILWGEVFLPVGFLYRTPLWYNPGVPLMKFDLYDAVIGLYPFQSLLSAGLSQGEFPLWNPYNFGGHPIAFNGQSGYFYPPRILLHALFPAWLAYDLSLLLHTFLAGFGMWLLGRKLDLKPSAALLVGTAWMLNPFLVWWLEFDIATGALTPFALLAVLRCRVSWRGAGALGLCIALMLLAGHLQMALYSIATVILVGLVLLYRERVGALVWGRLGVAAIVTGLLSAPMLLPAAHYLTSSQRPVLSLSFLTGVYQQFLSKGWAHFLFPHPLGDGNSFAVRVIQGAGEFMQPELIAYVGIVALVLCLTTLFWAGVGRRLTVLAIVVLLVPATPLYALVQVLPGFDRLISTRSLQLVHFLIVLAAGYGLDGLLRRRERTRVAMGVSFGLLLPALGWALTHAGQDGRQTLPGLLREGLVRLPKRTLFLDQGSYLKDVLVGFDNLYAWSNPHIWLPLACLVAIPVLLHLCKQPGRWLLGLLLLDLFFLAKSILPHHPHELLYADTPNLKLLRTAAPYRVMGVGSVKPNTLLPMQIADIAGYDSFYPRDTSDYLAFLMRGEYRPEQQLPAQVFPIKRYQSPLVDLMGVKYLVAYPGQQLEGKKLVQEAPLPIFENPTSLPRAFVVNRFEVMANNGEALQALESGRVDPRETVLLDRPPSEEVPVADVTGKARIAEYGYNRVRLSVKSNGPAFLVFTDGYADGWEVEVNGQATPLYRADVMFRAVMIPEGESEIVMTFRPVGFRVGLVLGGLGLLLVLGLIFYFRETV